MNEYERYKREVALSLVTYCIVGFVTFAVVVAFARIMQGLAS